MSDFKPLMVKDVEFLWNHTTEPTIYNSHEGRSVEVSPSTPGATWSLSFKVTPANDNMIMAAAKNIDPAAAMPPWIKTGKAGIAPTGRYA